MAMAISIIEYIFSFLTVEAIMIIIHDIIKGVVKLIKSW